MRNWVIAGLALGAVVGLSTIAQAAQQAQQGSQAPPQQQQMMGPMGQGHMMPGQAPMMNDPQMRQQMLEMMQGCQHMMAQMGDMRRGQPTRR